MPTIHTTNDTEHAIHVVLQSSYDYFTNNDVVRGIVRVHPTARPNGIKITFKGRCKSHVKRTLELFSTQRLLFNSKTHEESYAILNRGIGSSGNVELSFEFQFPNEVKMAPGDLYGPRLGFEHQEGHPLPTSMAYGDNKVEYLLEVAVYRKVEWPPNEIITLALPFRPTAAAITSDALVESPKRSDFCIRGHHLNPGNEQNPSALTRLKWATLSKYQHAVPEVRWRIRARCPFLLIAGSKVPISFALYHLHHSTELLEAPKIYVRRIRVKLTSLLSVRVPYAGPTGEREIVENSEKEILSQTFATTDKLLRHGLHLAEVGEFKLPPTILPSFKTYGLRLVYRIKVVVEGNCSQETFSVTALRNFCKVVCDVRRPERDVMTAAAASTSTNTPGMHAQVVPVLEEQLPAYEQAPGYEDTSPSGSCGLQEAATPDPHQDPHTP